MHIVINCWYHDCFQVVDEDGEVVGTKSGRKKPAYAGGLVLEPKKGRDWRNEKKSTKRQSSSVDFWEYTFLSLLINFTKLRTERKN